MLNHQLVEVYRGGNVYISFQVTSNSRNFALYPTCRVAIFGHNFLSSIYCIKIMASAIEMTLLIGGQNGL